MFIGEVGQMCLKAERTCTNPPQCGVPSNSRRRSANEKAIKAEEIEKAI